MNLNIAFCHVLCLLQGLWCITDMYITQTNYIMHFLSEVSQLAKVHSILVILHLDIYNYWYQFIFMVQLLFQKIITPPPWESWYELLLILTFLIVFLESFFGKSCQRCPSPPGISKTIPSLEDVVVDCNLCDEVYFKH